jgi:hypothetical protein
MTAKVVGDSATPAAQGHHVGLGPGLVDEHWALGVDAALILTPLLAPAGDVWPILITANRLGLVAARNGGRRRDAVALIEKRWR